MNNSNLPEKSGKCSDPATRKRITRSLELNGWLLVCALAYVAALFLDTHHPGWSPLARTAVALTPILPGLFLLRKGIQLLREMDELQRRIQFWGWFFASVGTVIVSAVINEFAAQGLRWNVAPHGLGVGGTYLTVVMLWGIGAGIANFLYR